MKDPRVSVIIPTYNRAKTLPRAVESVLNQTFDGFELLIVDDGSIDNTKEVTDNLKSEDDRIQYFYQENNGAAAARNLGIKKSSGEYIAFLDSDDKWLPEKLKRQINFFQNQDNSNLGFIGCNKLMIELDNSGKVIERFNFHQMKFKQGKLDFSLKDFLALRTPINPTTAFIKKDALLKAGLFDESLTVHEDFELWIRLAQKFDFAFDNEILAQYYIWDQGISKTADSLKKAKIKKSIIKKHKGIYNKYPRSYSIALRKVGTEYMLAENKRKAINKFWSSVKKNPLQLRNYINLSIAVLGGTKLYKFILENK